jgi:hypothetical protein
MKLTSAQRNALMVFAYYAPKHVPVSGNMADLYRWGIRTSTLTWMYRNGLILLGTVRADGQLIFYTVTDAHVTAMRAILSNERP